MTDESPGRYLAEDRHLTYPHCNGFLPDGRIVLGRHRQHEQQVLFRLDPETGAQQEILRVEPRHYLDESRPDVLWFDVARDSGRLAAAWNDRVILLDASDGDPRPRTVYRSGGMWSLDNLVSIDKAGKRLLLVEHHRNGRSRGYELELSTGVQRMLFEHEWQANHLHFCPADEQWRGYAHEGPATTIGDRVWGWHGRSAPHGRTIADQRSIGGVAPVTLGHERWMKHRAGAVVVSYGEGSTPPFGVIEVLPDGAWRLLSEGARDWHVDISGDGRWIVVDTTGPSDLPGRGWDGADGVSDILLIDAQTGGRRRLGRTSHLQHPYHPHPTFTLEGDAVLYNAVRRSAGEVLHRGVVRAPVAAPGAGH